MAIDTFTYDDLKSRLRKSTKPILVTDYVKPELLTKKGTLLKTVKDAHIQGIYDAFEAFKLIYGSAIIEHNEWAYSKHDSVLFSTIRLN